MIFFVEPGDFILTNNIMSRSFKKFWQCSSKWSWSAWKDKNEGNNIIILSRRSFFVWEKNQTLLSDPSSLS